MAADLTLVGDERRNELVCALTMLNGEAMKCHPSPRYDDLHALMNRLLDQIVGL